MQIISMDGACLKKFINGFKCVKNVPKIDEDLKKL